MRIILITLLRNTHTLKGKLGGSCSKQDEDGGGWCEMLAVNVKSYRLGIDW